MKDLNLKQELLTKVKQAKMRYLGHTLRNNKCKIMKIALQGKIEGKRKRGRRYQEYMDNIKKWTGKESIQIYRTAEKREEWKKVSQKVALAANIDSEDADR